MKRTDFIYFIGMVLSAEQYIPHTHPSLLVFLLILTIHTCFKHLGVFLVKLCPILKIESPGQAFGQGRDGIGMPRLEPPLSSNPGFVLMDVLSSSQ